ncbi:PilZ domain-containing protein [Cellvibrio sp.]|uniref:PilZ domain-containing protein n=1 Tax=Cellvibrio sp. TaxID=1965322 RepID=UPI0039647FFF
MNHDDRRATPRYPLRAFAELGSSDKEWAAHVLDISYYGARIALLDEYNLCAGDPVRLRLEIPEMQVPEGMLPYLHLQGTLVHQQEHMLGIQYEPVSETDEKLLKQILTNLNQTHSDSGHS